MNALNVEVNIHQTKIVCLWLLVSAEDNEQKIPGNLYHHGNGNFKSLTESITMSGLKA